MHNQILTKRKYDFYEVTSAMQKAIRRGDARFAGYWAIELFESGYHNYVWKRLLTISAEDCFGIITKEVRALEQSFDFINVARAKGKPVKGRVFISKAVILLAQCKKCRDADHLTNLIYDRMNIDEEKLKEELLQVRKERKELPDYAYDIHTQRGRMMGKTKDNFIREEFDALKPRVQGEFDLKEKKK